MWVIGNEMTSQKIKYRLNDEQTTNNGAFNRNMRIRGAQVRTRQCECRVKEYDLRVRRYRYSCNSYSGDRQCTATDCGRYDVDEATEPCLLVDLLHPNETRGPCAAEAFPAIALFTCAIPIDDHIATMLACGTRPFGQPPPVP